MKPALLTLAVLCLIPCALVAQPTLVLINGNVFTGDEGNPSAQAVAITGNTITAVGSNRDVQSRATSATRVIDLHGGFVIPGFNDAHMHPGLATPSFGLNPDLEATWPQVSAAIANAVEETPADLWITVTIGPPLILDRTITKDALDAVAPGRKVFVGAFTGHDAILSSAALKALRIPPNAADPLGGWYGRDEQNNLNGRVHEYAHYLVDRRFADLATEEEIAESLVAFSEEAVRHGITSVHAMAFPSEEKFARALRMANIPLRVRVIHFPMTDVPLPTRLQAGAIKFILDGTPIERGAALRTATYPDGTKGRENFRDLRPLVNVALKNNQQLLVHASGDQTIESALKAVSGTKLKRTRIEHADGLQKDLWPLALKTGAIAVINPTHFPFSGSFPPGYMPAASLLKAGIPLAIGSDGPMNPYLNLLLAVTRRDQPEEALSRQDVLRAYTSGSAFAEMQETKKGKIAPGMLADLAVLSQNIIEIPMPLLMDTHSVLTIIDGKIVHQE